MNDKIEKVLDIWHNRFNDEENRYSEFENSDVEYFVGCMLYNHFAFKKALHTMKTMDLSYDFLSSCSDEYDEVVGIISEIVFDDDIQKLKFLQDFISDSKAKYTPSELYLLNRLDNHIKSLANRYEKDVEVQRVEFINPLNR